MRRIHFDGMQVRRDIGWRAAGAVLTSYAAAGVDIDEGARAVDQHEGALSSAPTARPCCAASAASAARSAARRSRRWTTRCWSPAPTASAPRSSWPPASGRYRGVGADIVNHCINDVLVQGARPLFFLDYIASSQIDADRVAEVVTGMAEACAAAGCALLGGETAEMPGVYADGAFDIAGTLIGVVERRDLLPRADCRAGDVLIGVASNGPHTNGYSLLRRVFEWLPMDSTPPGFDRAARRHAAGAAPQLPAGARQGRSLTGDVKALAHITGGGLPDNLPRVLPDDCDARIQLGSWPMPPLFALVREVATGTRRRTSCTARSTWASAWCVVCAAADAAAVQASIDETTWVIGSLVPVRHVQLVPDRSPTNFSFKGTRAADRC